MKYLISICLGLMLLITLASCHSKNPNEPTVNEINYSDTTGMHSVQHDSVPSDTALNDTIRSKRPDKPEPQ